MTQEEIDRMIEDWENGLPSELKRLIPNEEDRTDV